MAVGRSLSNNSVVQGIYVNDLANDAYFKINEIFYEFYCFRNRSTIVKYIEFIDLQSDNSCIFYLSIQYSDLQLLKIISGIQYMRCYKHNMGERKREMFYLTTHSTHFIYGYMASDIWLRTILIVRKETRCRHIGYSYRLTARVLLYAPSHRQDNTYHGLCYTSRRALAGTRNSSMGPPNEGSIRRPIAPWANALPLSYVPLQTGLRSLMHIQKQYVCKYLT